MRPPTRYQVAFGLGLLSAASTVTAGLALQDIYHGEEDLTLEWGALRVSLLIIIAFHAFALPALWRRIDVADSNAANDAG
jgi:hypothetical protein